ncbi:hypothetical protein Desor_2627 [Desulfosporosinus orientis DSM 765]|uniref:Flavinylation-associated cytochrome domain-containing protein n=1 Tax=Desulfosporosinus orientis (strain ATCC 19365 / DSM 765 / NCIMB 8382 / VKM B-1628 / Singapore I) TaxID=768706 RepID=G7W8W7_DESOD|nr:DUF4405 domain-containing protein [Desulfosporosinus orientis]AET68176.1 hypothetical protein Desor_2627 [Desulfosporosinus orientis DSM 765]
MKNSNYIKLTLDIVIVLLFTLLYNVRVFGGLAFHEMVGLGIGALFMVHILLNWQWVLKVTQRLFDRSLPGKIRFGYCLNILLLFSMAFTIISGLMISKVLFPGFAGVNGRVFRGLHSSIPYVTLVLVGVHLGLHWQWIMGLMKKVFNVKSSSTVSVAAKVVLSLILLLGSIQVLSTQFSSSIAQITTNVSVNSEQIQPNGLNDQFDKNIPTGKDGIRLGHEDGKGGNANTASVIITFLGIIGGIAVGTNYIEKQIIKKPLKPQTQN